METKEIRTGRFYLWQGRLVTIRTGSKIHRISGYGALDTPVIPVVVVDDFNQEGWLDGQSFDALVSDLEEAQ
jgi:hypothetical protein